MKLWETSSRLREISIIFSLAYLKPEQQKRNNNNKNKNQEKGKFSLDEGMNSAAANVRDNIKYSME